MPIESSLNWNELFSGEKITIIGTKSFYDHLLIGAYKDLCVGN